MKEVIITNSDSCISYALKRIGREDLLRSFVREQMFAWLSEHFHLFPYKGNQARPGDLLLWRADTHIVMPRKIDVNGSLAFQSVESGLHMGVYEFPCHFSHLSRRHDYDNRLPIIKISNITKYKRLPDFVYRLKEKQ